MSELTVEKLKEHLSYNSDTGIFHRINSSAKVGTLTPKGYLKIHLLKKSYQAHRLAWLYVHGIMPEDQLDHENHDKTDNRIENLREVSNQENLKNQSMRSTNTSGFVGVYWDNKQEKWSSQIMVDAKCIFLGRFKSKQGAIKARKLANVKYGFHKNHGEKQTLINH